MANAWNGLNERLPWWAGRSLDPANQPSMMLLAQTSSSDPSAAAIAAIAASGIIGGLVLLAVLAFTLFCYAVIAKKAGYSPWLALLMLVPLANFIVSLIFVF